MNFPQTVDELFHCDLSTDRDSFGRYHIITGFEGTGGCFWCGKELEGRRRFCGHRSGHWTRYAEHFSWSYAKSLCLERDGYRCANCGAKQTVPEDHHPSWNAPGLEVHHIIPLEGEQREMSPYNVPWNLISFCHVCHQLIHAVMREVNRPAPPDLFDLAIARGQAVFEPLRQ